MITTAKVVDCAAVNAPSLLEPICFVALVHPFAEFHVDLAVCFDTFGAWSRDVMSAFMRVA